MLPLAFLNLGPSELAILLLLFLLLFGVDKVPQMARSLGKARAEMQRAEAQVREALETDDERKTRQLIDYEREREANIAKFGPPVREKLMASAMELDIDPEGMSDEQLKAEIERRRAAKKE